MLSVRYRTLARVIPPAEINRTVFADPDDDAVLACALAARADLIVPGDVDLLNLEHFHGIPITHAGEALARIEKQHNT